MRSAASSASSASPYIRIPSIATAHGSPRDHSTMSDRSLKAKYDSMVRAVGLDVAKDVSNRVDDPIAHAQLLHDRRPSVRKYAEAYQRVNDPKPGRGDAGRKSDVTGLEASSDSASALTRILDGQDALKSQLTDIKRSMVLYMERSQEEFRELRAGFRYLMQGLGETSAKSFVRLVKPLKGFTNAVKGAAISRDGSVIAGATNGGSVSIWERRGPNDFYKLKDIPICGSNEADVALTPDGTVLVTSCSSHTVRVFYRSGDEFTMAAVLKGHSSSVYGVGVSPDAKWIVSGATDRTARVWRRKGSAWQWDNVATLGVHPERVYDVALSNDATWVATTSGQECWLWKKVLADDTASTVKYERKVRLSQHKGSVYGVALSADGAICATTGKDACVCVWDRLSDAVWELNATLKGHTDTVIGVAMTPNGQRIISGSFDQTVRVWRRISSGYTCESIATGHSDWIVRVAISEEGKYLATASNDRTLCVWRARALPPPPPAWLVAESDEEEESESNMLSSSWSWHHFAGVGMSPKVGSEEKSENDLQLEDVLSGDSRQPPRQSSIRGRELRHSSYDGHSTVSSILSGEPV